MKYSKKELIELSKPYFTNKEDLQVMYATSDNQFFYPESKSYAYSHQRTAGVELYIISRIEAMQPASELPYQKDVEYKEVVVAEAEVVKPIKKKRK